MDGHTKFGSYKVTLELTGDMVEQLTRLLDMAKLMDGRDLNTQTRPQTMDVLSYRAFLEEILQLLYRAINNSKPVVK